MKLLIDDAVFAHEEISSDFGEVITLPGHDINREAARDCDVLIVRSRTQVNEALLNGSDRGAFRIQVRFNGNILQMENFPDYVFNQIVGAGGSCCDSHSDLTYR